MSKLHPVVHTGRCRSIVFTLLVLRSCCSVTVPDEISRVLNSRGELLRGIALSGAAKKEPCSPQNFTFISEFAYGRSGNNLIEFTHGLWLSSTLNRTLAVPGTKPSCHSIFVFVHRETRTLYIASPRYRHRLDDIRFRALRYNYPAESVLLRITCRFKAAWVGFA